MGAIIQGAAKWDRHTIEGDALEHTVRKHEHYEEDSLDAANLALAIKREDFTKNIELRFSCEHLPAMDLTSDSDPLIAVYEVKKNKKQVLIGITECIPDTLNPKFLKSFIFSFNVVKEQTIIAKIFDVDDFNSIENLSKHNYIGESQFYLPEVMLAPAKTKTVEVINPKQTDQKRKLGHCQVRANYYDVDGQKILFNLGAKEFLKTHDLQLTVNCRLEGRNEFVPVYGTEAEKFPRKGTLQWKPFKLQQSYFGQEIGKAYVKFEVIEVAKGKRPELIGEVETTIQQLIDLSGKSIQVITNSLLVGQIRVIEVKKDTRITFLNYLLGGCEVSLIAAIDMTNSNGQADNPKSLHHSTPPHNMSKYGEALYNIVDILQYFDSDNKIPFYGFGAKLPPTHNIVSHCFAINGNYFQPNVSGGAENLIKLYKKRVRDFKFHGPTILSEIIKLGKAWAASEKITEDNQQYYVLLILTDGVVNDLESTIDEIVEASKLPMSIIIVGLGEDRAALDTLRNQLDPRGKEGFLLQSPKSNKFAERETVHFFEYSEYSRDEDTLARECMRKLPAQVYHYMESQKISPHSPKKDLQTATLEYMHQKIDDRKKQNKKKKNAAKEHDDRWLVELKKQFVAKLMNLGYEHDIITRLIDEIGISQPDVNLFIELKTKLHEYEREQRLREQPPGAKSKVSLNTRLEVPPEIRAQHVENARKNPKLCERMFQVKQINQLDLLLHKNKKQTSKVKNRFIQDIQTRKPDDFSAYEQKVARDQRRQLSLEQKQSSSKQLGALSSPRTEKFTKKDIESANPTIKSFPDSSKLQSAFMLKNGSPQEQKQVRIADTSIEEDEDSIAEYYAQRDTEQFRSSWEKKSESIVIVKSAKKSAFRPTQETGSGRIPPPAATIETTVIKNYNFASGTIWPSDNGKKEEEEEEEEEDDNGSLFLSTLEAQDLKQKEIDAAQMLHSSQFAPDSEVGAQKPRHVEYALTNRAVAVAQDLREFAHRHRQCTLCKQRVKDNFVVFVPCGHAGCCYKCFTKSERKVCPICNTNIEGHMIAQVSSDAV